MPPPQRKHSHKGHLLQACFVRLWLYPGKNLIVKTSMDFSNRVGLPMEISLVTNGDTVRALLGGRETEGNLWNQHVDMLFLSSSNELSPTPMDCSRKYTHLLYSE